MILAPAAPLVCLDMIVTVSVQCVYLDEMYPQDVPSVYLDSLAVTVNLVSAIQFTQSVHMSPFELKRHKETNEVIVSGLLVEFN